MIGMLRAWSGNLRERAHVVRAAGPCTGPGRAPAWMLAVAIAALAVSAPAVDAQQRIDRRIAVAPDVSIKIWIPAGSIRLVGWDRDSILVQGTVARGGSFFFGGAGKAAKFGVEEPASGRPAPSAELVAYIPRRGRVNIRSTTASIEATDISGWFNTVAGNLLISGRAEEVNAEAMDGSVQLDLAAPYVRARSASGALTVAGEVEDLAAATVSGPLTVTSRGMVRARLESMTGRIVLDAPLDEQAAINIDSHGGTVELRLASPVRGTMDLTSVTGTISNGLSKKLPMTSRKGRGQELLLETAAGGPRIVVHTFKGSIELRPR